MVEGAAAAEACGAASAGEGEEEDEEDDDEDEGGGGGGGAAAEEAGEEGIVETNTALELSLSLATAEVVEGASQPAVECALCDVCLCVTRPRFTRAARRHLIASRAGKALPRRSCCARRAPCASESSPFALQRAAPSAASPSPPPPPAVLRRE